MSEKVTDAQRETLRVLGDGDWYDASLCDDQFRRTFRSLIRRGLLRKRGQRPAEVSITPAGREALKEADSG